MFELSKSTPIPEVLPDDWVPDNPGRRATKVAVGAATGRLVATIVKAMLSVTASLTAAAAMIINWF